jgi:hypothetical protein
LASESHDAWMLVERSHHEPPGCFPPTCKPQAFTCTLQVASLVSSGTSSSFGSEGVG